MSPSRALSPRNKETLPLKAQEIESREVNGIFPKKVTGGDIVSPGKEGIRNESVAPTTWRLLLEGQVKSRIRQGREHT